MTLFEPVRRVFRRFVRLDCQVVRESDFRVVADLALDLSTKGMLVRARPGMRLLTGEELVVAFKPPRDNRWFDAEATVARVIHGRRPNDPGLCFGIEFHNVASHEEDRLFEDLRGIPAPAPLRPLRPLFASA